jgi:hypothetical protein
MLKIKTIRHTKKTRLASVPNVNMLVHKVAMQHYNYCSLLASRTGGDSLLLIISIIT